MAPAGIVTWAGMLRAGSTEVKRIVAPFAGAGFFKLIVKDAELTDPPTIDPTFVAIVKSAGLMETRAVSLRPPSVAVMIAWIGAEGFNVVTTNVATVLPSSTVTDEGTIAFGSLDDN